MPANAGEEMAIDQSLSSYELSSALGAPTSSSIFPGSLIPHHCATRKCHTTKDFVNRTSCLLRKGGGLIRRRRHTVFTIPAIFLVTILLVAGKIPTALARAHDATNIASDASGKNSASTTIVRSLEAFLSKPTLMAVAPKPFLQFDSPQRDGKVNNYEKVKIQPNPDSFAASSPESKSTSRTHLSSSREEPSTVLGNTVQATMMIISEEDPREMNMAEGSYYADGSVGRNLPVFNDDGVVSRNPVRISRSTSTKRSAREAEAATQETKRPKCPHVNLVKAPKNGYPHPICPDSCPSDATKERFSVTYPDGSVKTHSCNWAARVPAKKAARCSLPEISSCCAATCCTNDCVPSTVPSESPSQTPSLFPTHAPSHQPSAAPSESPSRSPSVLPSHAPSHQPSVLPSDHPSHLPSSSPSDVPTAQPSVLPTMVPTRVPSVIPSDLPSDAPSSQPSVCVDEEGWSVGGTTEPYAGMTCRYISGLDDPESWCNAIKNLTDGGNLNKPVDEAW